MNDNIFASKLSRRRRFSMPSQSCLESLEQRQLLTKGMFPADPIVMEDRVHSEDSLNKSGQEEEISKLDTNNSIATATILGSIADDRSDGLRFSRSGKVHFVRDRFDYYKIHLGNPTQLRISVTALTRDIDMRLLDSVGTEYSRSTNTGTEPEELVHTLGAGDYYIEIQKFGFRGAKYHLDVFTVGNSLSTATLETVDTEVRLSPGQVGAGDGEDYYKFRLPQGGGIELQLNSLQGAGDANLFILNSAGQTIGQSSGGIGINEQIRINLNAGTYYIRVAAYSSSGVPQLVKYTLQRSKLGGGATWP